MPFKILSAGDLVALDRTANGTGTHNEDLRNLLLYENTDSGNAERLVSMYGHDLRYCHAFKKWLIWDGQRWAIDDTGQACRLMKLVILEFLRQAIHRNESAERFAKASLDARRLNSALSLAEHEIYVRPSDLDTHPYALNFLNGTVDLRTAALRPHNRQDLITKLIRYDYRPGAPCSLWQGFLDQIMGGGPAKSDEEGQRAARLTDYLQRALGYSLTGCTIEKAVFVLFGDGNNGKSTMLSTFRNLVEEYSALLQVDTLMVRQESTNTQADLADLRGARFVQTSETEEGQRLAQGKLKRITQGMGKIKAVRKYENPIEFPETHKLWMDTNRKPTIRDADDRATFARLHPIPFVVTIPDEEIDRELPAKLLREGHGILAWAVEGARRYFVSGLNRPPEVSAARNEWRAESDQIGRFVSECCVEGEVFRATAKSLYDAYKHWVERSGEEELLSKTKFGTKIVAHAVDKRHGEAGVVYYGIGLRDQRLS